ncbi:MAG TPA: phosphatase PAP2 family protein [Cyclobacteriaceae bacterium]|nr:phosphatase PAP2 family protein [Cyclobacteriaceae bacterium]
MRTYLLLLLVSTASCFAQPTPSRELSPARGHYKQLAAFDPKPKSGKESIDKQNFITDKQTIERRLSLTPVYLTNVTVNDFKLPDPPANSSEQTRKEIDYLLALQKYRTGEDIRSSLYYANVYYNLRVKPTDSTYNRFRRNIFHIGRSVGSWFNPETLPVTADLMANVWRDASFFIWSLKFKYARIRPYVIDPALKNLEETDWAAYPSGHASNSYVNAFIYSELAPEFADFFIKDAYDMAHSREIIGVHYPSDSESGRIFARQFVNMLFKNEKFLKDFAKVKEEWAAKAKESFGD